MNSVDASLFEDLADAVRPSVVRIDSGHGSGAGTAWAQGIFITNHHVAPGATAVINGTAATVIAADDRRDLALLSAPRLTAPPLARRTIPLRPGELVLAIGHPWGLQGAVAAGIVAGEVRQGSRRGIRADVRLGPGNSGGPLVDARGHLVGLNTMVAGGLAIAIPVGDVERFVAEALAARRASEAAAG